MKTSPTQYKQDFLSSELGRQIRAQLEAMVTDAMYHTKDSYRPSEIDDGSVTFVEKHFNYLSTHPKSQPTQYMANLRLMTKVSNINR